MLVFKDILKIGERSVRTVALAEVLLDNIDKCEARPDFIFLSQENIFYVFGEAGFGKTVYELDGINVREKNDMDCEAMFVWE